MPPRPARVRRSTEVDLGHAGYDGFDLALAEARDTACISADRRLARAVETWGHGGYAKRLVPLTKVDRLLG